MPDTSQGRILRRVETESRSGNCNRECCPGSDLESEQLKVFRFHGQCLINFVPAGQSAQERLAQFDVYFPISIGFQILALPGFVKLADIFSYAEAKARKEVELASRRSDLDKQKQALQSTSTGGSLISADSLRAG